MHRRLFFYNLVIHLINPPLYLKMNQLENYPIEGEEMKLITKFLALILTPLVKDSSVVTREGKFAKKYSKPKTFVRLIYLIFYHTTKSPYESGIGMSRAFNLNLVANHVTTFRMKRPAFAQVFSVKFNSGEKPILVKEWVDGKIPSKLPAKIFLDRVTNVLLHAGLPTWQVRQPDARLDLRHTQTGIVALDYESVLPPVFVSLREIWTFTKAMKFFPLDFVNFELLDKELEEAKRFGYKDHEMFKIAVETLRNLSIRPKEILLWPK